MENSQAAVVTQRDKDAQYARDYYYRNRDAVLARMKAKRDALKRQRQQNTGEAGVTAATGRGRGRPRVRADVPRKEKPQEDPPLASA